MIEPALIRRTHGVVLLLFIVLFIPFLIVILLLILLFHGLLQDV